MADGVLSLKGTLVGARGSGSGGHVIKDNGTAVTQRPTMNMTDFDIADDNTNEETDIKPHRLTSAEMSEICYPLPDATTVVGNVRMSLLWENPSPSESFSEQTVSVDLSDYDLILTLSNSVSVITANSIGKIVYLTEGVAASGSEVITRRRMGEITSSGIAFNDAYKASKSLSGGIVDNTLLIPYRIYGIKLL